MAKKRKTKRKTKSSKTKSRKSKRTAAKRGKLAAKRRAKRSGIARRISSAFETVTGAAQDTERLRRRMRHQGMDEG
jgi:hypothetical protein